MLLIFYFYPCIFFPKLVNALPIFGNKPGNKLVAIPAIAVPIPPVRLCLLLLALLIKLYFFPKKPAAILLCF